jgi:hypothetical protein
VSTAAEQRTYNAIDAALTAARSGVKVFPVEAESKAPLPGFMWKQQATSKINEVVEDFEYAIRLWGPENVSVAWACGLDGYGAADLDAADAPDWWAELRRTAVINYTRRGEHVIHKFPAGMTPGNSTAGFPTTGWGEFRGASGYIVIAGPDRIGMNVDDLANAVEFPRPEWLRESGDNADAVDGEAVAAFIAEHTESRGNALGGLRTTIARRGEGTSIHEHSRNMLCMAAREAAAGLYSATDGIDAVREWWETQWAKRERNPGESRPAPTRGEWDGVVKWAVGQALKGPERIAEIQDRAAARLEAWKQAQAKRKRDALARWIEECSI